MQRLLFLLLLTPCTIFAQSITYPYAFKELGAVSLAVRLSGPIGPQDVIETIARDALEAEDVPMGGGAVLLVRLDSSCPGSVCGYHIELSLRETVTLERTGQTLPDVITWQHTYFEVVPKEAAGDKVGRSLNHLLRTIFARDFKAAQHPVGTAREVRRLPLPVH